MKSDQANDLDTAMPSPAGPGLEEAETQLRQQFHTGLNDILGSARLLELQATESNRESIRHILAASRGLLALIDEKPPASEGHAGAGENVAPNSTAAGCRVLYVEDNEANFSLVRRILQRRPDITLLRAARGETAAALARECRPRLILLDLNLPDIPGITVFQRVRAQSETQAIPIVVISADATPSQIERLLAMGARNYLTKPFNVQRFLTVVDEVLEEEAKVS